MWKLKCDNWNKKQQQKIVCKMSKILKFIQVYNQEFSVVVGVIALCCISSWSFWRWADDVASWCSAEFPDVLMQIRSPRMGQAWRGHRLWQILRRKLVRTDEERDGDIFIGRLHLHKGYSRVVSVKSEIWKQGGKVCYLYAIQELWWIV